MASTSIGATVAACSQANQAEGHACQAAEGVVRVTGGAAGDGEHSAQLGMNKRQQHDRDRADAPGNQSCRAGGDDGVLRAVQPAGSMIEPADAQSHPMSPTFRRRELRFWLVLGGASWYDRCHGAASPCQRCA